MVQRPYLNLGAGRIILPGAQPQHHALVDPAIYAYPYWRNVDRNAEPGIDCVMDLFTYPWPLKSNAYDGALLSHLVEHVPHEIKLRSLETDVHRAEHDPVYAEIARFEAERVRQLAQCQDGWWAFFSELYRVLTPGAIVHILSPYGFSYGAFSDPSHTRYLTQYTFTHSMKPDPDSPFKYETGGIHFEQVGINFSIAEPFQHLAGKHEMLLQALTTQINVAQEIYVKLECIK